MPSNGRNLSTLLGANQTIPEEKLSADIVLGPEQYATPDDLPLSGNQIGDQAFVGSSSRLYIWSGSGWYSVALINTSPAFDSGGSPEAEYVLDSIGGTATTITLSATDPEGVPIQYSAILSDSANDLATITQTDNVFVVTARSLESILANGYDSFGGRFNITFRASDGINLATALSEFTLAFAVPYSFQGSNYGYSTGGTTLPGGPTSVPTNTIDRFPFVSETSAVDVGDMSAAGGGRAGQSSIENGYASVSAYAQSINIIDKFPFAAATTNAVDVGGLSNGRGEATGQSSSENGYTSGGFTPGIFYNTIDKFPFSFEGTATDVGDLNVRRYHAAGQSSTTHGYTSGGFTPGPNNTTTQTNSIEKFPFAADTSASSVGIIGPTQRAAVAGQSSATHGYTTAGYFNGGAFYYNTIDKFPFASDANASDVGDLTIARAFSGNPAGQSSTTDGYNSGGSYRFPPSVPVISVATIDKFPFTSDTNASNIGNLTVSRTAVSGQQF